MGSGEVTAETDLLVIGGGPGGYVAAFRAADMGIQTTIVDDAPLLGGVCLREGCIPSKALLNAAHLITHAAEAEAFGVTFGKPQIDVAKLREWKRKIVEQLCGGVTKLASKRKVRVIPGRASFEDSGTVRVQNDEVGRVKFKHAIVATGSRSKRLPESVMPGECYIDSTAALEVEDIPQRLLIVGAGYIGLELGQVYAALGSRVTVVEMLPNILPGIEPDLARPLGARLKRQFEKIYTSAMLESARRTNDGVEVSFTKADQRHTLTFDRVLLSIGRGPNCRDLDLQNTKVKVNERGFIDVDAKRRTSDPHIYAIGDVAGEPMLAHKASREGVVAAEAIAGKPVTFDAAAIPAVVYTSPEVAVCGLTEAQAKERGLEIKVGKFQWGASGRALTMGRPEGVTKVIADANTKRVLGVGIVGEHAGDLIAEAVLAIEMGAKVEDLATTIHPHPATSETLMEAAESVFGTPTHMFRL